MLSAIAARKAAQKLRNDAQEATHMRNESSAASSETEQPPAHSVTSDAETAALRKRKAKGQDVPRKMRRKRITNSDIGRARYFEAEQPIEGFEFDDFQSESPNSRGYSPSQPSHDAAQEDGVVGGYRTDAPGPSRAFSPSRPALDSSDDENDESGLNNRSYSPPTTVETSSRALQNVSHRVFVPGLHGNCFRLTSDDLAILDIESGTNSSTGTLIVLPPGQSLTFVGAAYITLLQGVITVLGTPIQPSLHSHRVFSPRSSPLASIEALDMSGIGDEHNNSFCSEGRKLPQRIQNAINASDSIVVIRPLVTGFQGLGKVCRTFDGVFDVGPDIREADGENVIGVEGFHPVRTCIISTWLRILIY